MEHPCRPLAIPDGTQGSPEVSSSRPAQPTAHGPVGGSEGIELIKPRLGMAWVATDRADLEEAGPLGRHGIDLHDPSSNPPFLACGNLLDLDFGAFVVAGGRMHRAHDLVCRILGIGNDGWPVAQGVEVKAPAGVFSVEIKFPQDFRLGIDGKGEQDCCKRNGGKSFLHGIIRFCLSTGKPPCKQKTAFKPCAVPEKPAFTGQNGLAKTLPGKKIAENHPDSP